jgi:CubicO group peptidase (beta-lactamase class C family)
MTAQELFTSICGRIPDPLARHKVSGVVLGITSEGRDLVRGFGVTNIDHPLPVDENTLFQIGSTAKTFTATAAMRLVEQKKLALDQPIPQLSARFLDARPRGYRAGHDGSPANPYRGLAGGLFSGHRKRR